MGSPYDDHYADVVTGMLDGAVVPLLGPGVAGATATADHLSDQFATASAGLAEVAQRVAVTLGERRLYTALKSLVAAQSQPGEVHRLLAEFPGLLRRLGLPSRHQLIVSANYDSALERAFEDANEPFDYAVYIASSGWFVHVPWGERESEPVATTILEPKKYVGFPIDDDGELARTVIVKIHGGTDGHEGGVTWRNNYVVTEDHYIDYLPTHNIQDHLPIQILDKLTGSRCLFLGYVLRNWDARVFLRRIWRGKPISESSWAIEPDPDPIEKASWSVIGHVELLAASLPEYAETLRAALLRPRGQIRRSQGLAMNPAVGAPKAGDVPGQRSPFQGLGFYTEDDAKWFFGRTVERKVILAHLRTAPLTVLYAESGVGKSSLLRAGVAARLRELAARTSAGGHAPRFVPVVFSAWKDDPVEDLIAEIDRQARPMVPPAAQARNGGGPQRTSAPVPDPTPTGLAAAIRRAAAALDATLVIILDQFEEHFSYRIGARDPDRLADELAQCVRSSDVPANFLIAVREDAYGRLGDLFGGRIANVYDNYLHLEYLSREAAREAIEKPVEIYNSERDPDQAVVLDDDLADAVLDQVRRGRLDLGGGRVDRDGGDRSSNDGADEIETPFLQLVMTRLWERERTEGSRVLRTATLDDELGGAETIVRNHVSGALAGLAGQELDTATDIFRDLVTPSGAKVAHTAIDLAQMTAHSQDTVAAVLNRLYEERILRAVDPAPGTTDARYEIYHDRLAAPILDWRDQQENARLERARQRAELEAETQRHQARRFKRRARIMLGLVVGLLLLLVAVAVLLKYAQRREQHRRPGAPLRRRTSD